MVCAVYDSSVMRPRMHRLCAGGNGRSAQPIYGAHARVSAPLPQLKQLRQVHGVAVALHLHVGAAVACQVEHAVVVGQYIGHKAP